MQSFVSTKFKSLCAAIDAALSSSDVSTDVKPKFTTYLSTNQSTNHTAYNKSNGAANYGGGARAIGILKHIQQMKQSGGRVSDGDNSAF